MLLVVAAPHKKIVEFATFDLVVVGLHKYVKIIKMVVSGDIRTEITTSYSRSSSRGTDGSFEEGIGQVQTNSIAVIVEHYSHRREEADDLEHFITNYVAADAIQQSQLAECPNTIEQINMPSKQLLNVRRKRLCLFLHMLFQIEEPVSVEVRPQLLKVLEGVIGQQLNSRDYKLFNV